MPRYEQPARVPKPSPVFVNVLPKGKACLACRARKVRCSGEQPVCHACITHCSWTMGDPTKIDCQYVAPRPRRERRGRRRNLSPAGSDASVSASDSTPPASGSSTPATDPGPWHLPEHEHEPVAPTPGQDPPPLYNDLPTSALSPDRYPPSPIETPSTDLVGLLDLAFASLPAFAATLPLPDHMHQPPTPNTSSYMDEWLTEPTQQPESMFSLHWNPMWSLPSYDPLSAVPVSGDDSYWSFLQDEDQVARPSPLAFGPKLTHLG